MATLTIPEEVIPEKQVVVDLYKNLSEPMYFCPGIGGVYRDIKWIAEALKRSKISFTPGELMRTLTHMVKDGLIELAGATNTTGEWYVTFTEVSHRSNTER